VLPYLMPAFEYETYRKMKTVVDSSGVCMQSNGWDCGPAAAVTVLRKLGLPAEEGELAIASHTSALAGTHIESMRAAIEDCYKAQGVHCEYRSFESVAAMRGMEPLMATTKFAFMVDHFVAVLAVHENEIEIGDPLQGRVTMSISSFAKIWRKGALVVTRNGNSATR
jgi:ABC-type bacteriocin/lantibiotic exporter with double-glycine peptidase domain